MLFYLLFIAFMCVIGAFFWSWNLKEKTPLTEDTKVYAGKWISNDGSWIRIYIDGAGDMKDRTSSITGGTTLFENDVLKISVFNLVKEYKINLAPYQEGEKWYVVLNGFTYVRTLETM